MMNRDVWLLVEPMCISSFLCSKFVYLKVHHRVNLLLNTAQAIAHVCRRAHTQWCIAEAGDKNIIKLKISKNISVKTYAVLFAVS